MVELLSSRHVGPPRAFISHRWQCPFRDTADAVLDHFGYGNLSPSEREEIKVRPLGCPLSIQGVRLTGVLHPSLASLAKQTPMEVDHGPLHPLPRPQASL